MKKNKLLIISIIIFLLICFIGHYRTCQVEEKGVYTIATIYNLEGAKGGISFDFKYSFKGIEYRDHAMAPTTEIKISDERIRFFIQVLSNNPKRCFFTDYRVPDFIKEAPYEGWVALPDDWKIIKEDN